jgi:hypothetical protein
MSVRVTSDHQAAPGVNTSVAAEQKEGSNVFGCYQGQPHRPILAQHSITKKLEEICADCGSSLNKPKD